MPVIMERVKAIETLYELKLAVEKMISTAKACGYEPETVYLRPEGTEFRMSLEKERLSDDSTVLNLIVNDKYKF